MSRWLALGEPVVRVTVRLPRLKSKDERLRERAVAYVRVEFAKFCHPQGLDDQLHRRGELRTLTLLAERKAVLKKMSSIPRRRVLLRRLVFRMLLEKHGIAKWW